MRSAEPPSACVCVLMSIDPEAGGCYNPALMELIERVASFVRRWGMLTPGERVVAGVSGGADSLCLLDCLHRLGYEVHVAHFDHRMRLESGEDADFVKAMAGRYGAPFHLGSEDVLSQAGPGQSLEDAARQARYRFLLRVANDTSSRVIAIGHTADDQAETVLMHFLMGAGPKGLRGMLPATTLDPRIAPPESRAIRVVRPLLELRREETAEHCLRNQLAPRVDPSNSDRRFLRNRLRLELLPLLERYNPRVRESLLRTSQLMAAEAELADLILQEVAPRVVRAAGEGVWAIKSQEFLYLPTAVQRALLQDILRRAGGAERETSFEAIERGRQFVGRKDSGQQLAMPERLWLIRLGEEVVAAKEGSELSLPEFPQLPSGGSFGVIVPGETPLACGWKIKAWREELTNARRQQLIHGTDTQVAAFDEKEVQGPLALRGVSPGDRLHPLNMQGTVKVAHLFSHRRVPRPARGRWPILTSGEEVIWVVGLRMADEPRLKEGSKEAVLFHLLPPPSVMNG